MKSRSPHRAPIDMNVVRQRLSAAGGRRYWKSLEELAGTEEFEQYLAQEFPDNADQWSDGYSRRRFLQLMSASFALAGLSACTRRPEEKIVPYVDQPEEIVPGKPLFFATALAWRGFAQGVIVESHEGRPTKIEGNPQHPATLGATDAFLQAALLSLYDPERSQVVNHAGTISTWEAFLNDLTPALAAQRVSHGAGLRILTGAVTSPTLSAQIDALLQVYPAAKWHRYEPVFRDSALEGARAAFGEDVDLQFRFDRADIVLSLDDDFLAGGAASVRYAKDFASRRRVENGVEPAMSRLYSVESTPGLAGAIADHRLPLKPSLVSSFARAVARELGLGAGAGSELPAAAEKFAADAARDLSAHRGSSLVTAGDTVAAETHALVHRINHALGNAGRTVVYTAPVETSRSSALDSIRELCSDMRAGKVELLAVAGGNPVFDAPADLEFQKSLAAVPMAVHLAPYEDETSEWCRWHIPQAHELETWTDIRAFDGTITICQPLTAPLYGGKSTHELVAAFLGQTSRSSHDIVREFWKNRTSGPDFEKFWKTSLHDGLVAGTALPEKNVALRTAADAVESAPLPATGLEVVFRPDPTVWDGSLANNGWLQELPKPITKLTWDNAALFSFATAERLGLGDEDVVEMRLSGRSVRAPVLRVPGHADDTITLHFGYGRRRVGVVGKGTGFDAYPLRASVAPWTTSDVEIVRTGDRWRLASTQHHNTMDGRALVRAATLEEFRKNPNFAREMEETPPKSLSLYPGFKQEGNQWGMAIDLSTCIGCNACVVACQAENNIPIVGKDQVLRGREMHWIRIDRYYSASGGLENPRTYHEPVLCMHCENAPCEVVCPVGATVHSEDGLNQMVYNRCVGTKYCANNCPYKVRRFNFLEYNDNESATLAMLRNPNVTVRSRGVMEKCSYCVQRVSAVRIEAEKENRPIRDGEVRTACQQACPAEAIVFGDTADPASRVSRQKADVRNYGLLTELNTRPRTTYLARLSNPAPGVGKG